MPLKILHINDTCTGCGACVSACPKNALTLSYNDEGFYYPHLNEDLCVRCKLCEKVCHVLKNDLPEEPSREFTPIMLKAKSKKIMSMSSSGGVFSLLADYIIKQGGVVYGARYNYEKEQLEHISTDICDISELRKSKYIESYSGDSFKDVKLQLQKGRKVLYCGTPCQIKGLNTYLDSFKIKKENLLSVRFICHGVPANKFFTEYKHYIENKVGSSMEYLDFRPKTNGWRSSNMLMRFSNGKIIDEPYNYNYYYYYFQLNYLLRASCYNCHQLYQNTGDLTIADFWGIYKYRPENTDQDGISLVLQQSEKGKQAIAAISNICSIEELPQSAVDYIFKDADVKKPLFSQRGEMMNKVIKNGYMSEAKKALGLSIFKIKSKAGLKDILKKVGIWKLIRK